MNGTTPLKAHPHMGGPGMMRTPNPYQQSPNPSTPNFQMGQHYGQQRVATNWSVPPNPYIVSNLNKPPFQTPVGYNPHATPSIIHPKSAASLPMAATPQYPRRNPPALNTAGSYGMPASVARSASNLAGSPLPFYAQQQPQPSLQYRKPLLPYANTYAARLKEGATALLIPGELPGKRRRAAAKASSAAIASVMKGVDVESDSDSDYISEDSDGNIVDRKRPRRGGRRSDDSSEADDVAEPPKPAIPPRRAVKRTKHDYLLPYYRDQMAATTENLVPIKLEVDLEGFKLKDSFMWNMKEKFMTPEKFADLLCEDLDVPASTYSPIIVEIIKSQLQDHYNMFLNEVPFEEDTRITINLDIQFANFNYKDRFEWDLASPLTPAEFAKILAADLGLGGEFATLVAHAIAEKIAKGRAVTSVGGDEDEAVVAMFQDTTKPVGDGGEGIKSLLRGRDVGEWGPIVEVYDREAREAEAAAKDKERNARRVRRGQDSKSGGGSFTSYGRRKSGYGDINGDVVAPGGDDAWASPEERAVWRCIHCLCSGKQTSMPMNGPTGPRTLCHSCGMFFQNKEILPDHRKELFKP
ncbi:Chromatin structure remodeling complex protein sfh1 [Phlyctochytrium planicorne]|nr:Chromatin structure remodeling complex protein sfh1 [Phlyctochytrium planicorne]